MIQFNIKTKDKTLRVSSPASWREINLGQLIDIETKWDKKNPVQLFSIISGLDIELLKNSKQEGLENKMMAICAFAYDQPNWEQLEKPKYIEIGSEAYITPKDISKKMLGQKIMINQIAIKEGVDLIKHIPRIVAVYMQHVIDGDYKDDRIEEIETLLLKSSAMECFALARFFFSSVAKFDEHWGDKFAGVPEANNPDRKIIERLAKVERLSTFSDIGMIDKLVVESNGAYTHDEAFKLDVSFAYFMLLYYYEKSMYQERADSVREQQRNLNK